jgi:hypothetical protein
MALIGMVRTGYRNIAASACKRWWSTPTRECMEHLAGGCPEAAPSRRPADRLFALNAPCFPSSAAILAALLSRDSCWSLHLTILLMHGLPPVQV